MQQFFFLCTMLIIATEAFSEDLSRILVPKKTERQTSGFSPKPLYRKSNRFIPGDVDVPGLSLPYLYGAPYLVPFNSNKGKDSPLQRTSNRLRPREKFLRRRKWTPTYPLHVADSFTFTPLRYSGCLGNSDFLSSPRRDLTSFVSYGPRTEYWNQYAVNSQPEIKKREPKVFKRQRLSSLERRYLNRLKNKNKRNTNNTNNGETNSEEDKKAGTKHHEAAKQSCDTFHKPAAHVEEPAPPRGVKGESKVSKKIDGKDQKQSGDGCEDSSSRASEKGVASEEDEHPVPGQKTQFKGADSVMSKSIWKTDGVPYSKNMEDSAAAEENLKTSPEVGSSHITKLKEMLEQVQTLLRDDYVKKEKSWKLVGDKGEETSFKSDKQPSASALKDKIDTAIPMLMQISEDLLKISNTTNKTNGHNDKVIVRCSPDGTWTSKQFGLEMTFKTLPNMMLKVTAGLKSDGMINKRWSIQGLTLSKEGGPLILAAVCPQKRKIASFLGQCKICKENDIIFGTWTFYTFAQKFTDLWKAVEFKLDVLKKKT